MYRGTCTGTRFEKTDIPLHLSCMVKEDSHRAPFLQSKHGALTWKQRRSPRRLDMTTNDFIQLFGESVLTQDVKTFKHVGESVFADVGFLERALKTGIDLLSRQSCIFDAP